MCDDEKHVLIVDDEPDFAALLKTILTKAGFSVSTACKCEDALNELHRHRPDLITLDIQMPRKSGIFFYRQFKIEQDLRSIPVIVVTAVTRDKEMEILIKRLLEPDDVPHPEAYIEKPINPTSFLKTVRQVLA